MIRDIYPPRVEFDFTKGSLQDQSANGYASTLTAGSAYWNKGEKGRDLSLMVLLLQLTSVMYQTLTMMRYRVLLLFSRQLQVLFR
jgi:hypothetical protein